MSAIDRTQTNEILQGLQPLEFKDQEGGVHAIYSFRRVDGKTVQAVFYASNELPFAVDPLKDKDGFILGDKPAWREKSDWDTFIGQVKDSSKTHTYPTNLGSADAAEALNQEKAVLFVESSPKNILDLAFVLGMNDADLQKVRQQLEKGEFSPRAQAIVDRIIAGKVIDDKGQFDNSNNTHGEALAVMALLGDKRAQEVLEQKHQRLAENDQARLNRQISRMREEVNQEGYLRLNETPLVLKDLVAVHTTRYRPFLNPDGNITLQTSFDATSGRHPRNTIHFSLNHPVGSHYFGNWEAAPYVVVAPLDQMMEINGNPKSLNTVDTFFERSPADKMVLPGTARLVEPGPVSEGKLYEIMDKRTVYKGREISPADVKVLFDGADGGKRKIFSEEVTGVMAETLERGEDTNLELEKLNELTYRWGDDSLDIVELLENQPVSVVVKTILARAGIAVNVPSQAMVNLEQQVKGLVLRDIKEKAVAQTLVDMGYENKEGAGWAWGGNSLKVTRQTFALGAQLGIAVGAHIDDVSEAVSADVLELYSRLMDKPGKGQRFSSYRAGREAFKREYLPRVSAESRRMLYMGGLI